MGNYPFCAKVFTPLYCMKCNHQHDSKGVCGIHRGKEWKQINVMKTQYKNVPDEFVEVESRRLIGYKDEIYIDKVPIYSTQTTHPTTQSSYSTFHTELQYGYSFNGVGWDYKQTGTVLREQKHLIENVGNYRDKIILGYKDEEKVKQIPIYENYLERVQKTSWNGFVPTGEMRWQLEIINVECDCKRIM